MRAYGASDFYIGRLGLYAEFNVRRWGLGIAVNRCADGWDLEVRILPLQFDVVWFNRGRA